MSWFGETFGEGLNSLKGQITKITKEVLADDEATTSVRQESENLLLKELEALCKSKDLEIASLRNELSNLKAQKESNGEIRDQQSEFSELKQERDYLNKCLEELQTEHEINLKEVISMRDKYKSELNILNKEYNALKIKLNEAAEPGVNKDENDEINKLNLKIKELELLLENERKKSEAALFSAKDNQNKLEKLTADIDIIQKENKKIIDDKETIQKENELLKKELSGTENETKIKLNLLTSEKKELEKKFQTNESKLIDLKQTQNEIHNNLVNLLKILDINDFTNDSNFNEIFTLAENKAQKLKQTNEIQNKTSNDLELELNRLKDENKNFQNKLSLAMEKNSEMEIKYQEEISGLKNTIMEMKNSEQDCINQSQTDDVKRLEQELAQCMNQIHVKNNEINHYSKTLNSLEQEIKNLKSSLENMEQELVGIKEVRIALEKEVFDLKNLNCKLSQEKAELETKVKLLESEEIKLNQINDQFQNKIKELEQQLVEVRQGSIKIQHDLENIVMSKCETEKTLELLQNENFNYKNEFEKLKKELDNKNAELEEQKKQNTSLQEEVNKSLLQNNELLNLQNELKKWKDASVDLQIHQEDLTAKYQQLETQYQGLKLDLDAKHKEVEQLKLNNSNLMKSCNELHNQLEIQISETSKQTNQIDLGEINKQKELLLQLEEENNELKCRIQKFQEQLKVQVFQNKTMKDDVQQHRRSKSDINTESHTIQIPRSNNNEVTLLKEALQQEQAKSQLLQHQFQEIFNKEANARKEFERLRQHLIEVEDHYTEEAVENEKVIKELKSKLVLAEEQLQNSSTLYTSLKIRDNQHLESLQSQIKMVTVQRDDLQGKLSAVEDEIQKHKASLMSLQIVLEQFQQDKEQEVEKVAMKYEKQIEQKNNNIQELEMEVQGLKNQLLEAKNGLKAASRLGEQLEKKVQQVSELEEKLKTVNDKLAEFEKILASVDQANNDKIDKSLIKNLIVGYILSSNADRKSQVLKIMASVLDFDQEERNKMGVDISRSGWLSNILHPKADGQSSGQSLSEAFIRFLENESRPQPQLKLLPEQVERKVSSASRTSPKPSAHLSELMLPTFNSSHDNESSIILKNVLKDS